MKLGFFFFFQAEDGIRDLYVTGVQTCALPISWITAGRRRCQQTLLAGAMPPFFDGSEIVEKIGGPPDSREGIAQPVERGCIIAGLDIAPVLLDQGPQIGEDALPVQ